MKMGIIWAWLFILTLSVACSFLTTEKKFTVQRGTNISHWLSQSDRRGEERVAWFTEKDVAYLASLGFDHLRIPVDEEQLWDEAGNKELEAFALLQSSLDWSEKYGLRAIVDLHILRSHYFNAIDIPLWTDPAAQDHFVQLWRELSTELKDRPAHLVAYELMNEAVAEDPDDWNQLVARAFSVVREQEPERVIVIGSNRWQIVDTFDVLKVPENDPNILLSFHFYTPMTFTHHQASWWRNGGEYTGPVKYPGLIVEEKDLDGFPENVQETTRNNNGVFNADTLEAMLEKPLKKREELGLPLYCGEWGCLPTVPEKDRMQWYTDMRTMLEKNDIGWATWDYKGDFGIRNRETGEPVEPLIEVLLK
ncbi:cellulase family glycosylhydrolase [candidate division KSB1 bacterium]|nr:cellulase family glycosylhydrolase [candidate division KSB1 bacterium]